VTRLRAFALLVLLPCCGSFAVAGTPEATEAGASLEMPEAGALPETGAEAQADASCPPVDAAIFRAECHGSGGPTDPCAEVNEKMSAQDGIAACPGCGVPFVYTKDAGGESSGRCIPNGSGLIFDYFCCFL